MVLYVLCVQLLVKIFELVLESSVFFFFFFFFCERIFINDEVILSESSSEVNLTRERSWNVYRTRCVKYRDVFIINIHSDIYVLLSTIRRHVMILFSIKFAQTYVKIIREAFNAQV